MSPLRNSIQSKCCCDVTEPVCYQLGECTTSTGCADGGVFVSLLALQYLQQTHGSFGAAILCFSDTCCLDYSFLTQFNEFTIAEVLEYDPPALIIYSESEEQGGKTIEEVRECEDGCSSCSEATPTGACCHTSGRGTTCVVKTQEECKALPDGVYHGDDTCCDPPIGDCPCPEENCKTCSEDVPDCEQYCGLCVVVDDNGNESNTWCSGSEYENIGCADTLSCTFNFPPSAWVSPVYANTSCPDTAGVCEHDLSDCCTGQVAPAMGGTIPLEKVDGENKWINVDDQLSQPQAERPDPYGQQTYLKWTYLGSLGESFMCGDCAHVSNCFDCGNPDDCRKCNDPEHECNPCPNGTPSCPCCCCVRWMSCWGRAEVWQDSPAYCDAPTVEHGMVAWKQLTQVLVMNTGCLDPYVAGSCDCGSVDPYGCYPTIGDRAAWGAFTLPTVFSKVCVPECGCPNGIGSAMAHYKQTSVIPNERCYGSCGCNVWISMGAGLVSYNEWVNGMSWSIS